MKNLMKFILFSLATLFVASAVAPDYVVGTGVVLGIASLAVPAAEGVLFATIPLQDARSLFTKTLIDVYKEQVTVKTFLRSFFEVTETTSKEVSIEVRRGTEKVAADVFRHSSGNRQKTSKSSEKIWVPPYYHEYIVANEHQLYDVAIGARSPEMFARLATELAEEVVTMRNTIERAYELQCAEVLETGIVTLDSGDNIDFKRKAASLVDKGGGAYWATGTVDPYADLENGCTFLRQQGKAQGSVFNAIMGSEALSDFLTNTIVKERADIRRFAMDDLRTPQVGTTGATFHGEVTCGSYRVRIWAYPEYYDNASGASTPYVNAKKVIIVPEMPRFKLAFAAVPQLISDGNTVPQKGAFMIQEFIDERAQAHEIHLKSAGIAVPVAVDQIYTVQVVA